MPDVRTHQSPTTPSRNDSVTMTCPVCGAAFRPMGRRRFCSAACRQAAWRQRQPAPHAPLAVSARAAVRSARTATVYECPSCGTRFLGDQRCAECNVFCRRIGPGGPCPHCDDPVALADLLPYVDEGR
jgi:predicted RNA-binding Zn-ribbon protein involved in translation (DUF1610 family)